MTSDKKLPKVLMLITNFGKGGAQRVFFDHAVSFAAAGFPIEEAVFNAAEDVRIYDSGLPLHSLDSLSGSSLPGPLGRMAQRIKSLKAIVEKDKVEIVISHMDGANWINVLGGKKAKKLLVVHGTILHDHDQHPLKQWFRKRVIIPWLYNRADLTVAVSEGIAYELKEICKVKNVTAIPNFFDIAGIREKAQQPIPAQYERLFATCPVLITSGRLADQKKQDVLPEILKELKKTNPQAKLVILGDGPLREQLIQKTTSLGLKGFNVWDTGLTYHEDYDVYFLGYIDNPYQYLRRSTLFLFPSAWEGFPMALCEAMISGVPVLSADCPTGPREILSPGTKDLYYTLKEAEYTDRGVLLPMTDKEGCAAIWVSAAGKLLADADLRNRLAASAGTAMQQYDKSNIVRKWIDIIKNI